MIISGRAFDRLFPNECGNLLVLGVLQNTIEDLRSRFPLLKIESMEEVKVVDKNQYDAIIVFLALEKDPDRESKLQLMYDALKPGKKGMIFFSPKEACLLDREIEKFLEKSRWKRLVSKTPNLSRSEFHELIHNIGFSMSDELMLSIFIESSEEMSNWISRRWSAPELSTFSVDFRTFLAKTREYSSVFYMDLYATLVEKPSY